MRFEAVRVRNEERQVAGSLLTARQPLMLLLGFGLALLALLVMPPPSDAESAPAWGQGAADAANTNRAVVDGPMDPGLRWAIGLGSIVTDDAPDGYAAGGLSAVHSPIVGPDGRILVPVTNPATSRPALIALDPDSGEVAWELQRRGNRCAPAVDSQGRIWAGMNFDYDDRTSNRSLRAFDADGQELDGTLFDLGDLGVPTPDRWCGIDVALHLGGRGDAERLVLFHVGDNRHIAALDISGSGPIIDWQVDATEQPFDRFADSSVGGFGGGPSARLAALTDTHVLVPVTTGDTHQLAFLSLTSGEVERLVDLPVFDGQGQASSGEMDSVNVAIVGQQAVVSMSDRGDVSGVLHGVSLTGTSTSPEWTTLLPSDTRGVSGGSVLAVSGTNVVVPSLGRLQAVAANSGAVAAWSGDPETLVNDAVVVTGADGAVFTTYRPAAGAMNVVRYSADGRLDWQLRRTSLAVEGLVPGTESVRVGPITGDGALLVRVGSLLYAIDDSGGLADCEIPFDDVAESNVHAENICRLVELEVTTGISASEYGPSLAVTRAQMGTFLQRALGLEPSSDNRFPDVDPASVHAPGINAIAEAGITLGRGDGTYDPSGTVTRAEMASFLARAAGLDGVQGTGFVDVDPGSVHAPNIYAVRDAGITTGVTPTTFDPDGSVTRAQMASFLLRTIE